MITIIGGSGFIGSALCRELASRKLTFKIIDLKLSAEFPEFSEIVDIRDFQRLEEVLEGEVVVNLAAVHRDDVMDKDEYYSTNVQGAKILCQACEKKGIRKLIFTSSVAVYGFAKPGTDEDGTINPFNEYGRTKALAEKVYVDWRDKDYKNRSLIIVRPTVVFGEGNRGNVYNLLKQINSGNFAMVGSGENKKSMAYVGNVAAFLLQCIQSNVRNRKYNYVDKPDFTMNELVTLVRERLGGRPGVGLRIPWVVGILGGYFADFLSLVGIKLPISSLRVKKFCSTSEFSSAKDDFDEFQPPFTLQEGLERTLLSEFINPDPKKIIFFTE